MYGQGFPLVLPLYLVGLYIFERHRIDAALLTRR